MYIEYLHPAFCLCLNVISIVAHTRSYCYLQELDTVLLLSKNISTQYFVLFKAHVGNSVTHPFDSVFASRAPRPLHYIVD